MFSRRTNLIRSAVVGCALAGAAVAGIAPAAAAPVDEPAFTSHTFRTDFVAGDPFPFGYEILDAATNGTGNVRFSAGPMCNPLGPRCAGFTQDLSVRWINFANGASGATVVGSTPTTITTGNGPVGIWATAVTSPIPIGVPAVGLLNP